MSLTIRLPMFFILSVTILMMLPATGLADRVINSVTLDGDSSVSVAASATISTAVTVTTSGNGSNDNWQSTAWRISTSPPGAMTCVDHGNHNNDGTYTETFNMTAPATGGTYSVYIIAYRNDDCSQGSSSTTAMTDAVTVTSSGGDTGCTTTSIPGGEDFKAISGSSDSNIIAVGKNGVAYQFDGTTWSAMTTPTSEDIEAIHMLSNGTAYAIDDNGRVLFYDGSNWSTGYSNNGMDFKDVWAGSVNEVYAVGESGRILYYDGSSWTDLRSAAGANGSNKFEAVWGNGTSVYAVDENGNIFIRNRSTGNWTSTNSCAGSGPEIEDAWADDAGNVYLADKNTSQIYLYNGSTCSAVASASDEPQAIHGSTTTGDIYAVGKSGVILYYDGSSWTESTNPGGEDLEAVWVASTGSPYFAGDNGTITVCSPPDNLQCFNDDFSRVSLGSDWAVSSRSGSFGDPRIVNGRLRLTDSSGNVATATTLLRLFPGTNNQVIYEFDHYAYNGNGADGIAVALSDASATPVPGGYGGSLGYAQRCGDSGFAGGWLGVGIDEYGNFRNDQECRGDGGSPTGRVLDSVSIRGSGSNLSGYLLHGESGTLNPPVDNAGSSTPAYGHRYRVTVDHSDSIHAYVTVERDTGSGYQTLIPTYDAMAQSGQSAVPLNWLISMTGSTGGSRNIHEIDNLQVCATSMLPYNSIDHYRFYHDGSGLTCSPENIQVKACLDANCTVEFAGNLSATLGPTGWVGGDSQTFLSGSTLQLWNTTVGTASLQVSGDSSEFVALNSPRCFIGATEQANCDLLFHDSGFVFDVPDHVADTEQLITISAVRKDLTTDQCVPGFQNVTRDIAFWSSYLDPLSGSLSVSIDLATIVGSSPGTSMALDFNSAGESTFSLQYPDVGQLSLNAFYQGTVDDAGLVMTGVDNFIARPDRFVLTIPDNPSAADAMGAVFKKAGETFKVQVEAQNASGHIAPNYGKEAVGESVVLVNSLVVPTGESNPLLTGSFNAFGTDCDGNITAGVACGEFSWNEVGIISLLPAVYDGDYLGSGNVSGNISANVGRFVPERFSVSANTPMLSQGCFAGGFTYLGQEFSFLIDPALTVTALGGGGMVMQNYGNSFWKLSGTLAGRSYSNASAVSAILSLTTVGVSSLTGDDNYDGVGVITLTGEGLTFDKPAAPVASFTGMANLDLTTADFTDADGVCYDETGDGTCDFYQLGSIGSTEQEYGRVLLQNAYGPEVLDATVPISVEYYSVGGYVPNTLDSCTAYNVANLVLSNYQGALVSGDTTPIGSGLLVSGGANMILTAPGAGNDGSVDLIYDLDAAGLSWLKENGANPTGKATFGIFKGNERLIYMREAYQ